MEQWQRQLEVIGEEIFLRYRKRLTEPGISWEIRRDYPGLSLPDIWCRVHAGRALLASRMDFIALRAIRSGCKLPRDTTAAERPALAENDDRLSRCLVKTGEALFLSFAAMWTVALLASLFDAKDAGPWTLISWLAPALTGCAYWLLAILRPPPRSASVDSTRDATVG